MSGDRGACPSAAELELHAAGGGTDPGVREHLERCDSCRKQVADARFELDFAAALRVKPARCEYPDGLPDLPGYEIVREVSRGGQGVVYEAIQTRTRRRVALKVLRQDHGISRTQRARFEREIEIAAALTHPGIVAVYDSIAMQGGRHALVLEYVEGCALDRRIESAGENVSRHREAAELIAKVCDAIHYAHQRGVIHRDLKPSNILVDGAGKPRILDFGVACWFGATAGDAAKITLTGEFAGTLAYAAPEQVSGVVGAPDLRSDLYALGVMLYQLCFGSLPYEVNGPLDSVIRNIVGCAPTRTRVGLGSGVEEDLWVIINKSLAKEPDRRYQSAAAMGADLRRYLNGETVEARRDSRIYVLRKTISRHRYAAGAIAAAFLGLGAFGVTVAMSNARLSEALRTSTIERARALGAAGSRPEADLLLWPEILRLGGALEDPARALYGGTTKERKILWAFVEMQGAAPCLASVVPAGGRLLNADCDNEMIVSVSDEGEVAEWTVPDLRLTRRGCAFKGNVLDYLSSAKGNRCVRRERGDLVCVDTRTGAELSRREFSNEPRISMRISRNGSMLVAWSAEQGVRVFELPSMRPVFHWRGETVPSTPWLSDGGDQIGMVENSREITIFRLPDGGQISKWPLRFMELSWTSGRGAIIQNLAVSEDGKRIALGSGHHLVMGPSGGREVLRVQNATGGNALTPLFAPSGSWLLTRAGADPTVKLWRTAELAQARTYPGHSVEVRDAMFTPDERNVVTTDFAGVLRVWAGPRAEAIRDLPDSSVKPHDIAIDVSGGTIWAADSSGQLGRWSLDGLSPPSFLRADEKTAYSVAYSRESGMLAAGGEGGAVSLFAPGSTRDRVLDVVSSEGISSVRFSPDGRSLAACGRQGPIVIYDTTNWTLKGRIETEAGRIVMMRWSPDGAMLAVAGASRSGLFGSDGVCEMYDMKNLRLLKRWKAHPLACRAVEFSPDGRMLVTAGNDGVIRLHDVRSLESTGEIHVTSSAVFCVAFHSGGRVLAVGDRAGRVTLIGLPEVKALAHIDLESSIMAMEFAGDQLVAAQLDHAIKVCDFGMIARCIPGNMEYWKSRLVREGAEKSQAGQ